MSNKRTTSNIIVNNMLEIMEQKGIRQLDLSRYLGVAPTVITQWKTGKTRSYMNYIDQICEFLDVTDDELLHPEISKAGDKYLTPDLKQMVEEFSQLEHGSQKIVFALIHDMFINRNTIK